MSRRAARLTISILAICAMVSGVVSLGAQTREFDPGFPAGLTQAEDFLPGALDPGFPDGKLGASTALAGPIDPRRYRLGPGDVLRLEYSGRANFTRLLTVDSEGTLRIPNLGSVFVGGGTLAEVRRDILDRLKPFIPGATLDLRLIRPRLFKVFVVGAVRTVGVVEVRGSATVLEALERAGGVLENASSRNIRVIHRDGEEITADLERFRWTGEWQANPYLEDGDRILVPSLTRQIWISGAVPRPGHLEFRDGDRLLDVVDIAGGLLSEARHDSVLLIRFSGDRTLDSMVVDLDPILDDRSLDIPLQEDDRIFIRSRARWHPAFHARITGEVMTPGAYAISEGEDRVSDLIRWSDGFTPDAAIKSVRLLRRPEIDGQDVEFDRLSRLTRAEMTDTEYQTFRGKLAMRQSAYLIDFSTGSPQPPSTDVLLKDGDIVEVERIEMAVRVDGLVRRPGFVAYQENKLIGDYIRMAGGTTKGADGGKIRMTRAGSNESQRARRGMAVDPGDFIWVPEKKETSFWGTFKDVITVAGQAATIIILVDTLNDSR